MSQHSLSLCIMKKNFCFHRQTEMLLESLAPLSSEDKELPVHTELTITAPLPWMEMDLDSVTFSNGETAMLSMCLALTKA